MNTFNKRLDKIKKLLALSQSTNSYESAIALKMAQKLMVEHGIELSDARLFDIKEESTLNLSSNAKKLPEYILYLSKIIQKTFGCKAYFGWHKNKRRIVFYGQNERPIIAAYACDVLSKQLTKARKAYIKKQHHRLKRINKIARADAFCTGWVLGVGRILDDFVLTEQESNQLQLYYENKIDKNNQFTDLKTKTCNPSNNANSINDGYQAGQKVQLHKAVYNRQEIKKIN